jgi:hypothetical protein
MPKARPVSLYPIDFDTALRAFVRVPKEEIDKLIEKERRQRKGNMKRRRPKMR